MPEGDIQLSLTVPGYTVKSLIYGTTDITRENMKVTGTDTAELRVVLDTTSTTIPGGGFSGGIVTTSSLSAVAPPPPPPPPPSPAAFSSTAAATRISPDVAQANLASSVLPVYPPIASAARVQGSVVVQVGISIEGRVQDVSVVSGHALFNEAALQAVRQRAYKPFVLNGKAIPVVTTVTVNFTLP